MKHLPPHKTQYGVGKGVGVGLGVGFGVAFGVGVGFGAVEGGDGVTPAAEGGRLVTLVGSCSSGTVAIEAGDGVGVGSVVAVG